MDTTNAIATLRKNLGLTQGEFANRLGLTITSISRYENGRRPTAKVLRKLAEVANDANLKDLAEAFDSIWKNGIAARLSNLPSAGTQRRVSLEDLKRYQAALGIIREQLDIAQKIYMDLIRKHPIAPSDHDRLGAANRIVRGLMHNFLPEVNSSIEPYINVPTRKEKTSGKTK
jgi:transcriptional regulator with XRE-family HTH domain